MLKNVPRRVLALLLAGICLGTADGADPTQERIPPSSHLSADQVNFTRDVIPALTKAGCNAGACHGSFQGRGGLPLSLLGFNPTFDYDVLTKASRGRRVNFASPDLSLLIRKPTGVVPHGGGLRFTADSEVAAILRAWLTQGAPGPASTDLIGLQIQVSPQTVVLRPEQNKIASSGSGPTEVTLQVTATFGDGSSRDITPWALFDVRDKTIAAVTSEGVITAERPGKTAVTVRYLGQVFSVAVAVPYGEPSKFEFPPQNFLDEIAAAEWQRLGMEPAPLADDATFVRRVYLDLIGTLPSAVEAQNFIADGSAGKRSKLINDLLERPEYIHYWSLKWGDLLRSHRRYLGDKGLASFNGWIRDSVRNNKPLDVMTRELLTAQGNLFANGPVAYYFIDEKVEDLAETTSQVFLGVRLQCTKCHHHPNEVWSQDDYYGLAAFFSRLETKDSGQAGARFGGPKSIRAAFAENPKRKTQIAAQPRLFGDSSIVTESAADPREKLAEWVTAKGNQFFARNFANRYWAAMFGIGLVEPVDDLRATNPASMPPLLDALASDFAEHGFDAKHLLRTICNSRLYQLAAEVSPNRDVDGSLFTHCTPRRLPAEVLLDAINQVTNVREAFEGLPEGTRAIALPDPSIRSAFLTTFGRPQRNSPCECARGSETDLSQALHLANSTALHKKIASPAGLIAESINRKVSDEELANKIYLAAFARRPTAEEREIIQESLAAAPSRLEGWQDILWAVLNCPEFVFNH